MLTSAQNSERGSIRHQISESEEALSLSQKHKASEMPPPVNLCPSQGPRWAGPKPLQRLYAFYGGLIENWRENLTSLSHEQL